MIFSYDKCCVCPRDIEVYLSAVFLCLAAALPHHNIIMFFGLTTISAIFQLYINRALVGFIDIYYIIYLDNILIYFINPADHQRYIHEILKRFRNFKLYLKLSKCEFSVNRVKFLSFMI